jgi:hypothetical protein
MKSINLLIIRLLISFLYNSRYLKMPARKGNNVRSNGIDTQENTESDRKLHKFVKDEIVWGKMKFFSAWPAKVRISAYLMGNGISLFLNLNHGIQNDLEILVIILFAKS